MSICQYARHAINQIYLHLLQPKVYYSPVPKTVQKYFIPCHRFWHDLYMYDKFSGCCFTKRPWVRPTVVWRRRLPHCKRAPVVKSCQICKHISRTWDLQFSTLKKLWLLLWEIPRDSGINSIFVELDIFGPEAVTSFTAGGNYIRGKRGMALISEVLQRLQFLNI